MIALNTGFKLTLVSAMSLLAATAAAGAAPEPCKVLPADVWGGIMGYTVTATPGDMNCTYTGKSGGGQFRIMAVAESIAAAEAGVDLIEYRFRVTADKLVRESDDVIAHTSGFDKQAVALIFCE